MSDTMSIEEVQKQIIKLVVEIESSDFSGLIEPANIDRERDEARIALMAAHTWLGLAAYKEHAAPTPDTTGGDKQQKDTPKTNVSARRP